MTNCFATNKVAHVHKKQDGDRWMRLETVTKRLCHGNELSRPPGRPAHVGCWTREEDKGMNNNLRKSHLNIEINARYLLELLEK
jgi:hypothetical protein